MNKLGEHFKASRAYIYARGRYLRAHIYMHVAPKRLIVQLNGRSYKIIEVNTKVKECTDHTSDSNLRALSVLRELEEQASSGVCIWRLSLVSCFPA